MSDKFSDRMGFTEPSDMVQLDTVSDRLRNRLWNRLLWHVFPKDTPAVNANAKLIWDSFCGERLDELPSPWSARMDRIKYSFFNQPWYQVYNLIEFIAQSATKLYAGFEDAVNSTLAQERSGYRLVGDTLVPVSSADELDSIETSLAATEESDLFGARKHLETAMKLLSQRPDSDYRNSIKESISAIESLVRQITG
jgi:hypothetical protein